MTFARRVVFDTGILVSAAIRPGSVPALAWERGLRHWTVVTSEETLAELSRVLMRDKFDAYASRSLRESFVAGVRAATRVIVVTSVVTDCVDGDDNKFLALALDAGATTLVASDPHLRALHPWRAIPIMAPAAFLLAQP